MKQSTKIPIILSEKYNLLEIIFVKRFCSKTAGKNIDQKPSHNTKYCLKKLQRSGKLLLPLELQTLHVQKEPEFLWKKATMINNSSLKIKNHNHPPRIVIIKHWQICQSYLYTAKISHLGFLPIERTLINLSPLAIWKGGMNKGLESFKIYKQERGSEIVSVVPRVLTTSNEINVRIITRLKAKQKTHGKSYFVVN